MTVEYCSFNKTDFCTGVHLFAAYLFSMEGTQIIQVGCNSMTVSNRPFHKTLPRLSVFVNWISIRFYERTVYQSGCDELVC